MWGILLDSFSNLSSLILPRGGPWLDAPWPSLSQPHGQWPVRGGAGGLQRATVLPILVNLGARRRWQPEALLQKSLQRWCWRPARAFPNGHVPSLETSPGSFQAPWCWAGGHASRPREPPPLLCGSSTFTTGVAPTGTSPRAWRRTAGYSPAAACKWPRVLVTSDNGGQFRGDSFKHQEGKGHVREVWAGAPRGSLPVGGSRDLSSQPPRPCPRSRGPWW